MRYLRVSGNSRISAVIDISSNTIRMIISQIYKGNILDLERLEYPVNIGHEVFATGIISFNTINEISNIIKSFTNLLKDYKVSKCKAIATTSIREAKNHEFVLEQLRIQNNIDVEILESSYEKSLFCCEAENKIINLGMGDYLKNALMVYIGTGSIGIAVYKGGLISFWRELPIGYVKMYDMFKDVIEQKSDINVLMKDYLDHFIGRLNRNFIEYSINNIIILGSKIETINNILDVDGKDGVYSIETNKILNLYSVLNELTVEKLENKFYISEERAKLVYSLTAIYISLLKLTKAKYVIAIDIKLGDCVISKELCTNKNSIYESHVRKNAISCAKEIADFYKCDIKHCEHVNKIADVIFIKLKKFHGLTVKDKTLLEICCYLHDCANWSYYSENMYSKIRNISVYGLKENENLIISVVSSLIEREFLNFDMISFPNISLKDKLLIVKLIALLKIANSLDRAHSQKIEDLKVRIKGNNVNIVIESDSNMLLEKWSFNQSKNLIKEILGVNLKLIIKSRKILI